MITSAVDVEPGAVIDCSGRDITVGTNGSIQVTDGFFTLKADDLTINANRWIKAVESTTGTHVGYHLDVTGSVNIVGALRADNKEGGAEILVDADGDITDPENGTYGIELSTSGTDNDGGSVRLHSGGDVLISCPLRAEGSGSGENWGGDVEIVAAGDIENGDQGKILVAGRMGGGGSISLKAGGTITIGKKLEAEGKLDGGDEGEIYLVAGDGVELNDMVSARGGVGATGGESYGGSVIIDAGCGGVVINGDIDVRGGDGSGLSGGALVVDSDGDITVEDSVSIITEATANGGDGGDVYLTSKSKVTLDASSTIDATGDTGMDGVGADVGIIGCEVEIGDSASIDVTAYEGGSITLRTSAAPGDPPLSSGLQPLFIDADAHLYAAGDTNGDDGKIELVVIHAIDGCCSNSAPGTCDTCGFEDPICTYGCSTGSCDDPNPDTDSTDDQFDVTPAVTESQDLGACEAACP